MPPYWKAPQKLQAWTPKLQKYKGRIVFKGDIVKDDSGAYAVFIEQGSSASHMIAATDHGCCCKITRLWWTSSWCSICLHPGKIGGCSKIAQNSEIRMSRCLETSSTTHMAKFMGEKWGSRGSSWSETCTVIHLRDCFGKDHSSKLYWNLDGKKYQIGNVCSFIVKQGLFLSVLCGWH